MRQSGWKVTTSQLCDFDEEEVLLQALTNRRITRVGMKLQQVPGARSLRCSAAPWTLSRGPLALALA